MTDFFISGVLRGTRFLCVPSKASPPAPPHAGGNDVGTTHPHAGGNDAGNKLPQAEGNYAGDAIPQPGGNDAGNDRLQAEGNYTGDNRPQAGVASSRTNSPQARELVNNIIILTLPPACGGVGGEAVNSKTKTEQQTIVEVPVELLKVNDLIYLHDGKPYKIVHIIQRNYSGLLFFIVGENGERLSLTEDHLVLTDRRVKHLTPSGKWSGIPQHHFERSRSLRHALSPPEVTLWCRLRNNQMGVKFRKQHPIGPFIADFYSHECGLVVEVDGVQHFKTDTVQVYDEERNAFMEKMGLTVLRFSAYDVGTNLEGVLDSIYRIARQHTLKTDPTKQWCCPEALRPGDHLYTGIELCPTRIQETTSTACMEEVVCDIQVEEAHS